MCTIYSFLKKKSYSLLQVTATREPYAATIATLTIGFLKTKLYKKVGQELGTNVGFYFKKHLGRFFDD